MSKKVVLIGGCFDLLHYGHLQFIKSAKKAGNFLVVALEPDEFIKKNKKRQPIHSQNQRAEILLSLKAVDKVIKLPIMNNSEDYLQLIKKVKPAVVAITKNDPQEQNKRRQAQAVGAKLKIVTPLIKSFSTTKVLQCIGFC